MSEKTSLFTFGSGHMMANYAVRIKGTEYQTPREIMFDSFGSKWSMEYPDTDANVTDLARWGTTILNTVALPNGQVKLVVPYV